MSDRQTTVRNSLAEAHRMNEGLQQKLDEFKAKNAALMAGKSASRSNSEAALSAIKEKPSSTPVSAEKSEKMHRDHRRMRKELAAALGQQGVGKSEARRKHSVVFLLLP